MYNIQQLEEKTLEELLSVAIEMGIDAKNAQCEHDGGNCNFSNHNSDIFY